MKSKFLMFTMVILICLQSCDNENEPSPVEAYERLLAGDAGTSKSWRLVSGVAYDASQTTIGEMAFDDCFLDNLYTFENTESQQYTTGEGTTSCNAGDPDEIERGFWAFVESREKLLISANDLIHVEQSLFGKFASPPATVLLLNESEMELEFDYTMAGFDAGTFRFTFEAVD
jgi:hypothetical protein